MRENTTTTLDRTSVFLTLAAVLLLGLLAVLR